MRRWMAVAALLALVGWVAVAVAQTSRDGATLGEAQRTGVRIGGADSDWLFKLFRVDSAGRLQIVPGGLDGSGNFVPFELGPNNELLVTELNPDAYQTSTVVICSLTVTQGTSSSLTAFTPFTTSSINGYKLVEVGVNGGSGIANAPWRVKFIGSADGVTWSWLFDAPRTAPGATAQATAPIVDLTAAEVAMLSRDTLAIRGRGATVGALVTGGRIQPLIYRNGMPVTPKMIAAICSSDSATAVPIAFKITIHGRQH